MPDLDPSQPLTLATLAELLRGSEPVRLAASASGQPQPLPSAAPLEPAYSATGLLLAYAAGTGPELPLVLVRRLLLLKAIRLSWQPVPAAVVRRLLDFFTRDVWPVVPTQGALGQRSNRVPLAHLGLPLLGLGEVSYQGYRLAAADVLGLFGWEPLALTLPEADTLLHGSEFTLAYATEALARAAHLLAAATASAALATAAYGSGSSLEAAAQAGFGGMEGVHAAARQALALAEAAVEAALNAPATPEAPASNARPDQAPPLLLAGLARAVAQVAGMAARRTAALAAGGAGLPPYLAATPGQPGLRALPEVTANLAGHNQQLVFGVAAAESPELPTRPLSTGAAGAAELLQLLDNAEQLLGLELLAATQALDFRRPARSSPALEAVAAAFRQHVTFVAADRMLATDLHRAARFVREYDWT